MNCVLSFANHKLKIVVTFMQKLYSEAFKLGHKISNVIVVFTSNEEEDGAMFAILPNNQHPKSTPQLRRH